MKIISDKRIEFDPAGVLATDRSVDITMKVDRLVLGNIKLAVRNKDHVNLDTVGVNDAPLTTGTTGVAQWSFDPSKLDNPRYVIWIIFVNYTGDEAAQFTLTVDITQGGKTRTSRITCKLDAKEQVASLGDDGLWIGAPL
jgi:hypothetical protein